MGFLINPYAFTIATATQTFDPTGADGVIGVEATASKGGEKVTDTTTRNKAIVSMTMRLRSLSSDATGTINFVIRKTSDSSIVATSTQSFNANILNNSDLDKTLNFNSEILPNESYYAVLEGITGGTISVRGTLSDTSANGNVSYWNGSVWTDLGRDCYMTITYIP